MGTCCISEDRDFKVPVPPQSKIKALNCINELIESSNCSTWPFGLTESIFLEVFTTWDIKHNDNRYPANWKDRVNELNNKMKSLLLEGIKEKKQTLHNYIVYIVSDRPWLFGFDETDFSIFSETAVDLLENEYFITKNNTYDNIGTFDSETKQFIKFMLSWNHKYFDDNTGTNADYPLFRKLKEIAIQNMRILQAPLIEEYEKISQCNNQYDQQLIDLEYKTPDLDDCTSINIESQRDLYPKFTEWIQSIGYKQYLSAQEITDGIAMFTEHKLSNPEIVSSLFDDSFVISDAVLSVEFFRQIAIEINEPFQQEMKQLFEQNRKEYIDGVFDHEDACAIYKRAPIKTAGRAAAKSEYDYRLVDKPECGNILDWVRCALVVYDTKELIMLYDKLKQKYNSGEIIRVKNGFKKGTDSNYGYRAILINIIYQSNGFKMIVEIQLILLKYLKIRKSMHLFYKIVRAENPKSLAVDISRMEDVDRTKAKDWLLID